MNTLELYSKLYRYLTPWNYVMNANTMSLSFSMFLGFPQLIQCRNDDYMMLIAKLTSQLWLCDTLKVVCTFLEFCWEHRLIFELNAPKTNKPGPLPVFFSTQPPMPRLPNTCMHVAKATVTTSRKLHVTSLSKR